MPHIPLIYVSGIIARDSFRCTAISHAIDVVTRWIFHSLLIILIYDLIEMWLASLKRDGHYLFVVNKATTKNHHIIEFVVDFALPLHAMNVNKMHPKSVRGKRINQSAWIGSAGLIYASDYIMLITGACLLLESRNERIRKSLRSILICLIMSISAIWLRHGNLRINRFLRISCTFIFFGLFLSQVVKAKNSPTRITKITAMMTLSLAKERLANH